MFIILKKNEEKTLHNMLLRNVYEQKNSFRKSSKLFIKQNND